MPDLPRRLFQVLPTASARRERPLTSTPPGGSALLIVSLLALNVIPTGSNQWYDHTDWAGAQLFPSSTPNPPPTVSITPTVLTTLLSNPGMGLQTCYQTKATDPNNGTLPLGPAYTRYYWSQFEPSQGNFSFTQMVNDYKAARAQGQDYCIRIMPYDNQAGGPKWMRNLGVSGYTYAAFGGPTLWAPNMDDPTVKAEFQKLVQALGARFDGLPGFGPIDIGSVGLWGEWHNYATNIISINGNAPGSTGEGTGNQIPMPPLATLEWHINLFFTYFPKTIKIMALGQSRDHADSAGQYALGLGVGLANGLVADVGSQNNFLSCLPNGINNTNWQKYPVYLEPRSLYYRA